MGGRIAFVVAVMLGALLLGSASIAGGQDKTPAARSALTVKNLHLNLSFVVKALKDYRTLVYGPPKDCLDADCDVEIQVAVVPVTIGRETQNICIARFPEEIKFSNWEGGKKKAITWWFDPGTNIITFHKEHGILVVADGKTQIEVDKSWTSEVKYGATNKHDTKGDATYVPILLYYPKLGAAPGVCATGDPKIVNY